MKILVIVALFSLLLLLLYSRIYPYILILKKIFGVAKTMTDSANPGATATGATAKSDGKLVRCVCCGTWIPTERAIGAGGGRPIYCSRECIEKSAASEQKKAAM